MIRAGLVGYGLAGSAFHAPLVRACGRMELSAVMTSRDVPGAVRGLDELLERSDLVIVASPNATHFEITKAAIEAGKHVVVDKPFTPTIAEADELIALAAAEDVKLTVFHNRRWDSDFLTVRKLLPDLGEVRLYEAHWDRFRPALREGWKEQPDGTTGVLNDLGPHLIDQALVLFGMPEALTADIAAQREGSRIDDYFELTLHYGDMRVVLASSTLVTAPRPRFAIHGTGGSFVKYGLDPQELAMKGGANPLDPSFGVDDSAGSLTAPDGTIRTIKSERGRYLSFYRQVADAIIGDGPLPVEAADARAVMHIIDLARQSARDGRRLAVRAPA
jgi:scyllo-inositol 2-dehydrogenase (NADP+)